jgi:hypothetical protein
MIYTFMRYLPTTSKIYCFTAFQSINMKRTIHLIVLFIIYAYTTFGQSTYWQQKVDYNIAVRLNDKAHLLEGHIKINYQNNSPDTLDYIYFHLWPNGYKNNQTALARQFLNQGKTNLQFALPSERGFIDSLQFNVDNKSVQVKQTEHIDIIKIVLDKQLLPSKSIEISSPFRVKIPGDFSRLGHDGNSYQVSQWYPKPAVYDQYGWHPMPYLDQGEFFSEFGQFTVNISVPENYRVASTGILETTAEINWLDSLASLEADTISGPDIPSATRFKTITYKQDNIHDFAWFADKRYQIAKSNVTLASGKSVATWGFYLPESHNTWKASAQYIDSAIYYYSKWVGEYPYTAATAVQGALSAGGGMEYPMVTVISAGNGALELDQVITHEVGHNWFYGILASNERDYPWMDEGFNTFIESRYMEKLYPNATMASIIGDNVISKMFSLHEKPYGQLNYYASIILGALGKQVPINTPSEEMNALNYGLNSYMKTGQLLRYLMDYLGEDMMGKCMHAYFEKYKFKHVYPKDMIAVFEAVSEEDLGWFFIDLFNTNEQIDAKIIAVKATSVKVKNIGSAKVPIRLTVSQGDKTAVKWSKSKSNKESIASLEDIKSATVFSNYNAPDINPQNNQKQKVTLNFLTGLPEHGIKSLYWLPYVGYNTFDKFILGAAVHNFSVIPEAFEFYFAPAYGFGNQRLTGTTMLKYDWIIPESSLSKIRASIMYESFSIYQKINPRLSLHFINKNAYSTSKWIELDFNRSIVDPELFSSYQDNQFGRLQYFFQTKKGTVKNSYRISLTAGEALYAPDSFFASVDFKAQKELMLNESNEIKFSFFTGTYLARPSLGLFKYNLTGSLDYGMNHYLVDRANNANLNQIGQQQVINDQAEFRSFNLAANNYLSSFTISYHKKGLPIQPYLSTAILDGEFYYESGLALEFHVIGIYLPLLNNASFNHTPENFTQWSEAIAFKINIGRGNLLNQIETLLD